MPTYVPWPRKMAICIKLLLVIVIVSTSVWSSLWPGGIFSLLSYLCPIISSPTPLVSKVFSVISSSFILCSAGCAQMYYPRAPRSPRRSQLCAHNLYRTLLVKLISLYALLRLRKLWIETENKPKINLTSSPSDGVPVIADMEQWSFKNRITLNHSP